MKVLIVSPAYPPFSGVGGMRMGSLSEYLRNQGVKVRVLRNNPGFWGDQNLKTKVPSGIEIIDVHVSSNFFNNAKTYSSEVKKIIESDSIDLIIYSVGPFYTLLTLYTIKKKYMNKAIIDFRDLWSYEKRGSRGIVKDIKFSLVKLIYRIIERPAVERSDGLVVVTPGDFDIMSRKYKNKKQNIKVISNGYEDNNFNEVESVKKEASFNSNTIQIVSLGKLGYYAPHLVRELCSALNEIKIANKEIELLHVGQKEAIVETIMSQYKNFKYKCTGYVDNRNALRIASESDIALIVYNHPTGYGTKVFDYIACNKPIILVTEEANDLRKFISGFKNSFVCKNKEQIIDSIRFLYNNEIKTLDDEFIRSKYSRDNQNRLYYTQIIEIVN